jgi:linoleoyl-CoA desaturase
VPATQLSTRDRVSAPSSKEPATQGADFAADVRGRVNGYFADQQISPRANGQMRIKTATLLGIYVLSYALILTGTLSMHLMWLLSFIMGVAMAGIGFSVCHDALHGAYSRSKQVNRVLGYIFDGLGANSYMWRITHNRLHHVFTNVQGYDDDVDVSPLVRLSPHSVHRPMHKYQHIYAFILYALSTLFWVFAKDYGYFLRRQLGPYHGVKHPPGAWWSLILGKSLYYLAMIVMPLMLLDITIAQFVIGFVTLHLVAGTILGVIFQLAHVVEPTQHLASNEAASIRAGWMEHQMRATNNFAGNNRLLSWYLGGINYQVEHHLFPKICHVHYRAMSPLVRAAAARYGLPYNSFPTLWGALRSHYRTLKRLGNPPVSGPAGATAGSVGAL